MKREIFETVDFHDMKKKSIHQDNFPQNSGSAELLYIAEKSDTRRARKLNFHPKFNN